MMSRYVRLFAIALLFALGLTAFGRRAPRATAPAVPIAAPEIAITLEVRHDRVTPGFVTVPKDRRVRLTLVHPESAWLALRLAGYEDRVAADSLAPGETRSIVFLADRPGGDFTWLINGRPIGRFAVTGSHLMGDHR